MLVLEIKVGHYFTVGKAIRVEVVSVDGTGAKVGITCPKDIPILRDNAGDRTPKNQPPAAVPAQTKETSDGPENDDSDAEQREPERPRRPRGRPRGSRSAAGKPGTAPHAADAGARGPQTDVPRHAVGPETAQPS